VFRCGTVVTWLGLGLFAVAALSVAVSAGAHQTPSAASERAKPSAAYAREPYVIERYRTVVRFDEDGTGERVLSVRIRVQSDAAVEKFAELVFPYDANHEDVQLRRLVVNRQDGSTVGLAVDAVKDLPAKVTAATPVYPGDMEKHVKLPALTVGDILEYEVATRIKTPLAANEFWLQHSFIGDVIVLDEELDLNLPSGRRFSLKAPGFSIIDGLAQPAATPNKDFSFSQKTENGRLLLHWKHANLTHPNEDDQERAAEQAKRAPDVQLTTFRTWQQVARWYYQHTNVPVKQNGDVAAKTKEILSGHSTDEEKIRAVYQFVSTHLRSAQPSAEFDVFRPTPAAEVLKDGYGDSQDSHALLATMLASAGIQVETALVPSTRKLDLSIPSPAQLDRVLTVVHEGANQIWLDPSAEVAPFGFLPQTLRGKSALLVSSDGAGTIVETPVDPPFPSTQKVEIEGVVSELGKLSGRIHYSLRGDTEFVLRTAFHRSPQTEWKSLAQTILTLDGLRVDVDSVKASDAIDTNKPFELNIEFSEQNFLGWSKQKTRLSVPLLTIGMPDPPKAANRIIKLGSPLDIEMKLSLKFPSSFSLQTPVGVSVLRDYAEFKTSYSFENGVMAADRSLTFKLRELSPGRAEDYVAFAHSVEADEMQLLVVQNTSSDPSKIPQSASADDLFDAGAAALKAGNLQLAIPLLERVTQLDPQHAHAWNDLGLAYFRTEKFDAATAAFQKQLQINPSDEHANDYLGLALQQQQRNDEAASAFRKQIEINPLDTVAHAALGNLLLEGHDDSGAALELEKATILSPDNAALEVSLGNAYLGTGDNQKAIDAFHKAVQLSPTATIWNNAAFNLAEHNLDLDEAQTYARSAVNAATKNLANVNESHVSQKDFTQVSDLAAYWDTLGWVYFHQGDLQKADRYILAAWRLSGRGSDCDHLAQIYEKLGQKDRAIKTYAMALAAPQANPETRARLILLLGGNSQIDQLVEQAKPAQAESRTFRLRDLWKENVAADFLIVFSAHEDENRYVDTRVDRVNFVTGSESLRPLVDHLQKLNYGSIFPEASSAKLVRRGTLACSGATSDCTFTLVPAEDPRLRN